MENRQNQNQDRGNRGSGRGGSRRPAHSTAPSEFQERVLEINRVTRVVKGGKRMRFRALVVIGDRISRIAFGLGKANDVTTAVAKAVNEAKKNVLTVSLVNGTLPYKVTSSHKSATVLIKPTRSGSGLIAGGSVRVVLDLAGVKDAVAKVMGSSNKISNVVATIKALESVQLPKDILAKRGKTAKTKAQPTTTEEDNA
ncbi:MAG: 30S ribosomal protein S5 [Patescibacteria group bacterium]|jgi:small subunit ribosomal protein S5